MDKKLHALFGVVIAAIVLAASLFVVTGVAKADEIDTTDAPVAAAAGEAAADKVEAPAEVKAEEPAAAPAAAPTTAPAGADAPLAAAADDADGEAEPEPESADIYVKIVEQSHTQADVGDTIQYKIMVSNDEADTLTNVTIKDELNGDEYTIETLEPKKPVFIPTDGGKLSHEISDEDAEGDSFTISATATTEDGRVAKSQEDPEITIGEAQEATGPGGGGFPGGFPGGDNPGGQPGDNPGDQPGDNPGGQPGDNPGGQTGGGFPGGNPGGGQQGGFPGGGQQGGFPGGGQQGGFPGGGQQGGNPFGGGMQQASSGGGNPFGGGMQQAGFGGGNDQGGNPFGGGQGGFGGVPETGDSSMMPMLATAVSGFVGLAGAAIMRRRDD